MFRTKYSSQKIDNATFDEEFGVYTSEQLVYNPATNTVDRKAEVYEGIKKITESGSVTYIGVNSNPDATDSQEDWLITKITKDTTTTIINKVGAWNDRASLFS